ncbi:MAG: YqgE/AlgH family protein [Amphiplicatus sp.]
MSGAKKSAGKRRGKQRDFLAGRLLIAMPNMSDPRFEHSVLVVCAHDPDHAMGVIVNKPLANVELGDLLDQLEIDPREGAGGELVYFGGPVQTDRGVVLHTLDYRTDTTLEVAPGVGLTATRDILVDIAGRRRERTPPSRFLVAIGYAGWGPGQLEDEISMNAWAHGDVEEAIVFAADPSKTWRVALERLGVTAAKLSPEWWSARPDDAPLN